MRLFVAIELPDPARRHLMRVQDLLRPIVPAKWVKPEQLHLTLKFLGETPDEQLPGLIGALRGVRVEQPIQLETSGVVCFPRSGAIRIVAAAMLDEGGRCAALQRAIDEACHAVGFRLEGRQFVPHLTLGRIKEHVAADSRERARTAAAALFPGPVCDVDEFCLIESQLDRAGPTYVTAGRFQII